MAPPPPTRPPEVRPFRVPARRHSKIAVRAIAAALLLALLLCLRFIVFTPKGGDPGGTILADLQANLAPTSALAPAGAGPVTTVSHDSVRQGQCTGLAAAQGGWSKVLVVVSFDADATASVVRSHVAHELDQRGWSSAGDSWHTKLPTGNEASATLGRTGNRWRVSASVEPRYYAPAHC